LYEQKTKETNNNVIEFIEKVDNPKKRQDAYKLLEVYTETTGYKAKMWGPSIIGFGKYHYKYKSGHEGEAPLTGFSPRKSKISLYIAAGHSEREQLLNKLGKHTTGKSCIYINKVDDIDLNILKKLIEESVIFLKEYYRE